MGSGSQVCLCRSLYISTETPESPEYNATVAETAFQHRRGFGGGQYVCRLTCVWPLLILCHTDLSMLPHTPLSECMCAHMRAQTCAFADLEIRCQATDHISGCLSLFGSAAWWNVLKMSTEDFHLCVPNKSIKQQRAVARKIKHFHAQIVISYGFCWQHTGLGTSVCKKWRCSCPICSGTLSSSRSCPNMNLWPSLLLSRFPDVCVRVCLSATCCVHVHTGWIMKTSLFGGDINVLEVDRCLEVERLLHIRGWEETRSESGCQQSMFFSQDKCKTWFSKSNTAGWSVTWKVSLAFGTNQKSMFSHLSQILWRICFMRCSSVISTSILRRQMNSGFFLFFFCTDLLSVIFLGVSLFREGVAKKIVQSLKKVIWESPIKLQRKCLTFLNSDLWAVVKKQPQLIGLSSSFFFWSNETRHLP